MTEVMTMDDWGVLTEPATLTLQRRLPGPIERVWAYLTESELRRQWLAAGAMRLESGASFEWTWRNDELTDPPGRRPDGFGAEHSMTSRIVELDPPRRLGIEWGSTGGVTFSLEPVGAEVLLTIVHRRLPDDAQLNISAGWHAHLDILASRLRGGAPSAPFWDHWAGLKAKYQARLEG